MDRVWAILSESLAVPLQFMTALLGNHPLSNWGRDRAMSGLVLAQDWKFARMN